MRSTLILASVAASLLLAASAAAKPAYGSYFFEAGVQDFAPRHLAQREFFRASAFFIPEAGYRRAGFECTNLVGLVAVHGSYTRRLGTICRRDQI